jgi:hypothetical protein
VLGQTRRAGSRRKAEHKRFTEAFREGKCSFCGGDLTTFDEGKPCRHWLLNPNGFRKQYIQLLTKQHSQIALENYLRWVANEEAFAQNINDLADEGTGKLVELTIKYKDIEWSFSCSANDLAGHESGSALSQKPHYHFQMYVDGKPLIRYNDYHLPLSAGDVGFLEYMRSNQKVRKRVSGGAGMSELLDESLLEHIVTMARSGETDEDAEKAPVKLDTLIFADPGTTIKGEDIYNFIQAAKSEGVTATSKMRELENVKVQTIVSPGPGVVWQATRSGRKRKGGKREIQIEDRAWREKKKREE